MQSPATSDTKSDGSQGTSSSSDSQHTHSSSPSHVVIDTTTKGANKLPVKTQDTIIGAAAANPTQLDAPSQVDPQPEALPKATTHVDDSQVAQPDTNPADTSLNTSQVDTQQMSTVVVLTATTTTTVQTPQTPPPAAILGGGEEDGNGNTTYVTQVQIITKNGKRIHIIPDT